jgi:hypothetical protein
MNNLIKDKLTEYLEFDSDLLFKNTDYLVVFGGAIRDIIADQSIENIKDIDILCITKSKRIAIELVEQQGWEYTPLKSPEMYLMYKELAFIFEPRSYIKNNKIIQFISPCAYSDRKNNINNEIKANFLELLQNVDIITSGSFYDGTNVYESIKGSISHIKYKITYPIKSALMYNPKRIDIRLFNLNYKGFKIIGGFIPPQKLNSYNRLVKMDRFKNSYPQMSDFIINLMIREKW